MTSRVDKILKKYNIDKKSLVNILTSSHKSKPLTSWNNTNIKPNQYQQADILYLPTTPEGFKFCLVVVDVETRKTAIRPMKKITGNNILKEFKSIYGKGKKNTLKKPSILQLDKGPEFNNKIFKNWLNDENIGVRFSETKRHSQQAIVEAMNRTIGTVIQKLLLNEKLATGQETTNWIDFIPVIVDILDKNALKTDYKPIKGDEKIIIGKKQKYEVLLKQGDKVRIKLDGDKFRSGDIRWSIKPYTIEKILILPNRPIQYIVNNRTNAYVRSQLKLYKEGTKKAINEIYEVDKLTDKKKINNRIHYRVKWKGYNKRTWEPRTNLINDGLSDMIKEYEKEANK